MSLAYEPLHRSQQAQLQPNGNLEAVAETYVGLSLRGTPPALVEQLASRVLSNLSLHRAAAPPTEL